MQSFADLKLIDSTAFFTAPGVDQRLVGSVYVGDWKTLHIAWFNFGTIPTCSVLTVIWATGIDDGKIQGQTQQCFTIPVGETNRPFMFNLPIIAPYVDIYIGNRDPTNPTGNCAIDVAVSNNQGAPVTPIGTHQPMIYLNGTSFASGTTTRFDAKYPYYGQAHAMAIWLPIAGQSMSFEFYEVDGLGVRNRIERVTFENGAPIPAGFQTNRFDFGLRGLFLSVDAVVSGAAGSPSMQLTVTPMPQAWN